MEPLSDTVRNSLAVDCLSLILLSSEQCNFRCTCCYEKFELGRMQAPVVRGVQRLLSRRAPELSLLSISWFGGEPLLALPVIREVHGHVASLVQKCPGLRFSANINTNGYLLSPEVFEELLGMGVTGYQISFDGPRAWHDKKRVLADGRGTFDRIWRNVTAMQAIPGPFQVILRVHVDQENEEALPAFIDRCGEAFKGDQRFKLLIRPLSRLGGANDGKLRTLSERANGDPIAALKGMAECRGLSNYQGSAPASLCYAAKANCFVVRADGRVNKCTVALDHPGNQVGRLNEDGTLRLDKHLMVRWMRGLRSEDPHELHCPLNNFPASS